MRAVAGRSRYSLVFARGTARMKRALRADASHQPRAELKATSTKITTAEAAIDRYLTAFENGTLDERACERRCAAGPGQRSRNGAGAGRLAVRERVEHRGWAVEVRDQEVARVVGEQWIQPHEYVADKMGGDHLRCERQVEGRSPVHSLSPPASDRGHPSAHPGPGVLPAHRVRVSPCPEPIGVQGQLVLDRRRHRDRPRWSDGRGELLRRRSGVLTTQIQQT
jgi:hypothetical protein